MYPSNWGSHAWIFLHTISFDYPDNPSLNDKLLYKNFFHSLKNILPDRKFKFGDNMLYEFFIFSNPILGKKFSLAYHFINYLLSKILILIHN